MPRVERHRRRLPGSWFRTTTVQSHYRKPAGMIPAIIAGVLALILLLVLVAVLF
ncbi:hypothetical protein [Umezawaea beigongshangensis]|uniref:hypothetical protein n=1 Tax=Umezawaea beigongshangensis TaxID=2780383 RepID=UPI0018F1C0A4|nr:hypothetical protein [Umezawaea beigongshangensis]